MSLKLWLVLGMQRAKSTMVMVHSIATLLNMLRILSNRFKTSPKNLDLHWGGDPDIRRWCWCIGMSSPFKSWGICYATWIMSRHVVNIFGNTLKIYSFWLVKILVCWLHSLHFKRLIHLNSGSRFQINYMRRSQCISIPLLDVLSSTNLEVTYWSQCWFLSMILVLTQ